LQQYWPGLLEICQDADELGRSLVEEWLCAYMFKHPVEPVRSTRARAVADFFADSDRHKSHSRPIDRAEADSAGVVIDNLEDSQELQDAVLSVHHATLITLQSTPSVKIIENDLGRSFVVQQCRTALWMRTTAAFIVTTLFGMKAPPTWSAGPGVFGVSRWCSGRRRVQSAVTSATAALALDSSTMALLAA
jgi:hypothetical protein